MEHWRKPDQIEQILPYTWIPGSTSRCDRHSDVEYVPHLHDGRKEEVEESSYLYWQQDWEDHSPRRVDHRPHSEIHFTGEERIHYCWGKTGARKHQLAECKDNKSDWQKRDDTLLAIDNERQAIEWVWYWRSNRDNEDDGLWRTWNWMIHINI